MEQLQNTSRAIDEVIRHLSSEVRSPQHLEIDKSAARTAPACATDAQRAVAYRHVLADISRPVKRQRQTQRFQHSVAIVEDHIQACEYLRQPGNASV